MRSLLFGAILAMAACGDKAPPPSWSDSGDAYLEDAMLDGLVNSLAVVEYPAMWPFGRNSTLKDAERLAREGEAFARKHGFASSKHLKATYWRIELYTRARADEVHLAERRKELATGEADLVRKLAKPDLTEEERGRYGMVLEDCRKDLRDLATVSHMRSLLHPRDLAWLEAHWDRIGPVWRE